jgi:hypothetical protein
MNASHLRRLGPVRELVPYALAVAVIVGLAYVFEEPPPPPPPPKPDPGLPPGVPHPPGWYELAHGSSLPLAHGRRYRACVSIRWPESMAITIAMVKARAEREGFTYVRVVDSQPPEWPGADCKWYVDATWSGPDQLYARPTYGGKDVVTRAWWLVPG